MIREEVSATLDKAVADLRLAQRGSTVVWGQSPPRNLLSALSGCSDTTNNHSAVSEIVFIHTEGKRIKDLVYGKAWKDDIHKHNAE
ncbi:hypothetical protein E6O75_ATG00367 [Venturia nashicola]|uniref:Uncharacterized protein n=1 Tax=Venturia nashicola TaxID=86259 RepID=A0A4Z1PVZ5_9PEZI|nr:hypothetical protein E6O75_ATG00367 [Venturia nashicola]